MLTNEVDALVHGLAIQVARRFRGVERDDLLQQGRLWVLAHPIRMGEWLEADDNRAWRQLSRAITAEMESYARQEKAAVLGYRPEDEAFYTAEMIESLLPAVFDPDREMAPVLERQEVATPSDPAVSAVWPCHLADVSAAWDRSPMDDHSRSCIVFRYVDGLTDQEILEDYMPESWTLEDVALAIHQGITAMVRHLGGERPRPCGRSCKECHGSLLPST